MHGHEISIAAVESIRTVFHEGLGDEAQCIGAPCCPAWLLFRRSSWNVWDRHLVQCCLQRFQHLGANLGGQSRFQHQRSVILELIVDRTIRLLLRLAFQLFRILAPAKASNERFDVVSGSVLGN